MKNNRRKDFLQNMLRACLCLCLLSGASVLMAQEDASDEQVAVKKVRRSLLPNYPTKVVKGQIFDGATHQPLDGVRIQAVGDQRYAAMTDSMGYYTVKVPTFTTALYLSTPEYNSIQLAIKDSVNQNATMHSDVFRSYFSTGTKITSENSLKVKETSSVSIEPVMEQMLNGDVRTITRGGTPGMGAVMLIRGINSINTNSQPLVIIDGVIIDLQLERTTLHTGFFNNILSVLDPEDVEEVQVLKNGTAIYGARGANGVILITTKRGRSIKTRINARIYGGVELKPSTVDMMSGSQFRSYMTELVGTTSYAKDYPDRLKANFLNNSKDSYFYPLYHNDTDWDDDIYHKAAFTQNYKINVQGGDERALYGLSLGYVLSNSTYKKNDFDRLNIRFNTDITLIDRILSTSFDISYARSYYNLRDNGWAESYDGEGTIASPNVLGLVQSPFLSKYAYYPGYYANSNRPYLIESGVYAGKYAASEDAKSEYENPFNYAKDFGENKPLPNPYWILENGDGEAKNNYEMTQFSLNVNPKVTINKHFFINNRFSYGMYRCNERYYLPYNGTSRYELEGLGQAYSKIYSHFNREEYVYNDFRLNWSNSYAAHALSAFGGLRFTSNTYNNSKVGRYNVTNDKLPEINNEGSGFANYNGLNDNWVNLAYYANIDYNYRNKYFLQGSMSLEASSRFGKKTNEGFQMFGVSWGFFPSLQAGWVISNEPWFNTTRGVNYMKLTAGYERNGNDNVNNNASRTYYASKMYLNTAIGLQLANIENPHIQWETTDKFNVGIEGGFFHNRLHVGVEYFNNYTSNLLGQRTVSYLSGLKTYWCNDGEMRNEGFDVKANVIALNQKNWKWQIGATIGHYVNKVTKLSDTDIITKVGSNGETYTINGYTRDIYGGQTLVAVGEAVGSFYGYQYAGVFSTTEEAQAAGNGGYLKYDTGVEGSYRYFKAGDAHFVDQNGDGIINENDKVVIGNANPDIYGNLYTNLTWKNLTLDVNFKYSLGNDVYNYQRSQLESSTTFYNQTTAVTNRWTHEGQSTDMPRAMHATNQEYVANERFSSRWIEDGSYLKLKNVRITYKFPIANEWLQGLSVWGEANNVFTLTKYLGTDPEVTCSNSVLYQGIDAGSLSLGRSFNLGVTINL